MERKLSFLKTGLGHNDILVVFGEDSVEKILLSVDTNKRQVFCL